MIPLDVSPADIQRQRLEMLRLAGTRNGTPFDYIVVGAGAAGGPLAARLAENGKTVLVVEAGIDPIDDTDIHSYAPYTGERTIQTYEVPAFHGASTEDPRMSWKFSVRHFDSDTRQRRDSKYDAAHDPSSTTGGGKGGIFYPRASGVGGCTTHHAMIVVRPNDSDWNRIAERTQDPSWRAENMQGYFARVENCLYYDTFEGIFGKLLWIYKYLKRFLTFLNPRIQLYRGGHGRTGWQKTSFIDPLLIRRIAKGDRTFRSVLIRVILFLLMQEGRWRRLGQFFKDGRFIQLLDPNFGSVRSGHNAQLLFIPVGTDGHKRTAVRERLAAVAEQHPLRLVITTQTLVTRVVFESDGNDAPCAIGVEVAEGFGLYEPAKSGNACSLSSSPRRYLFAREEIILAGGAFNSPQLLMLSGIGDPGELGPHGIDGLKDPDGVTIAPTVALPGVGKNLQDRYEISIVSETSTDFSTLNGIAFSPLDPNDPALQEWQLGRTSLYSTNGGALSFFLASQHAPKRDGVVDPDIFIFGAPAAFRGYYWGWSEELLFRRKNSGVKQRNLWSWLVLKAYTANNAGTVTLRDGNPFRQPEIAFRSFPTSNGTQADMAALVEGVRFVRRLNAHVPRFVNEIQPGSSIADGSPALRDWIESEAWGHHACGTCRIGGDPWRSNPGQLADKHAVLDGKFRVHGVQGLRVVDASVFPEIPGYFIVTPIYMIGEKAADELLASSLQQAYPARMQEREARAILRRRELNQQTGQLSPAPIAQAQLPNDTVGLALSGGGIRSATLCLGVLQALAKRGRLKYVDCLSTVSGGGYIGAFLGRLFTRDSCPSRNSGECIEGVVGNLLSAENRWLRAHANYISGAGRSDREITLGVIWRNLLGAHFALASMFIGLFAFFRWLTDHTVVGFAGNTFANLEVSAWWWLPVAAFVFGVFPAWLAYWLAPKPGAMKAHPVFGLFTWLIMLGASVAALRLERVQVLAAIGITGLIVAWFWQELARIGAAKSDPTREFRGVIVRNRVTRGLGLMLTAFFLSALWILIDSLARLGAQHKLMFPLVGGIGVLAAVMPLLRPAVTGLRDKSIGHPTLIRNALVGAVSFSLLAFLLFAYDVIAHTSFDAGTKTGLWTMALSLAIALVLSRAHGFLNLTSLNALYAARLARTFLGASSEARVHAPTGEAPVEVGSAHPEDDEFFDDYHPERKGGPLHFVSVCVNETVDALSGRSIDDDKGLGMCVGPVGVSVGRRFHALWEHARQDHATLGQRLVQTMEASEAQVAVCPLPTSSDPNAFHVLSRDPMRDEQICVVPERLRLSQWMAISGAAFTPGQGRLTNLPTALLLGLFNIRIGYWWNSGVEAGDRPGRYPPTFLRRLSSIPSWVFRTQSMLLSEWWRRFPGPGHRLWYLSDGGHIENSSLYELVRRRVRLMIMVDGTHDPSYIFDDLSALVRRVRYDFGASFEWRDPNQALKELPPWIARWINIDALGTLPALARTGEHAAALARVTYSDNASLECWLLVLKGCLIPGDMPLDLRCYSTLNVEFPHHSTFDQFFDDAQWESYRLLGEQTGLRIFRS